MTQTNPASTTKSIPLSEDSLKWHPFLEGIPLMAEIGKSKPRGANVKDFDADRSEELSGFAEETGQVWAAFQHDVSANLAEPILVCRGPKGTTYVVDGRDRVTALRLAGHETVAAEEVEPEDAERIIRSKTLRKHLTKGARAYMAALLNPSLAGKMAGNSSNKPGNSIVNDSQLVSEEAERVPESHTALAAQWGFDRALLSTAYKVIAALKEEQEMIDCDETYKPKTKPHEFVVKIFAGTGLGQIIPGLAAVRAAALGKKPPADPDATLLEENAILKSYRRMSAAVGTIFNQAKGYNKLSKEQRAAIQNATEKGLKEAHVTFKNMLGKCLKDMELQP